GDPQGQARQGQGRGQRLGQQRGDRRAALDGVAQVPLQEGAGRLQVLQDDGAVGAVGGADLGELFGGQAQVGVAVAGQDRIAGQRRQQDVGGGEGEHEHQQGAPGATQDV